MGNRTNVLQHSMSRHNMINPDRQARVSKYYYNRTSVKYAILRFSKCKILVGKTLTIQRAFVNFRQTFPPSKFCAIRHSIIFILKTHGSNLA